MLTAITIEVPEHIVQAAQTLSSYFDNLQADAWEIGQVRSKFGPHEQEELPDLASDFGELSMDTSEKSPPFREARIYRRPK